MKGVRKRTARQTIKRIQLQFNPDTGEEYDLLRGNEDTQAAAQGGHAQQQRPTHPQVRLQAA